jgi:type III pantothenate kinase
LNLVIDIGNTRVKAGLFNNNELVELNYFDNVSAILKSNLITKCSKIVVGSVVNEANLFINELQKQKPTLCFTTQTHIPITNCYTSATTLGSDRLAASIGSYELYQNSNVLTIDAGTCIKYNFVNQQNQYLGGGISPGIQVKFKALNNYTSKLPLINFNQNSVELIGSNTQNSILSGVLNGTIAEVDGIISQYLNQYPNLICIITGGDAQYLANHLKNRIFTHQNLVLKGLNNILNYNIETNHF